MGWSERQKEAGIRLELTWFDPRSCWKKKIDKKTIYFKRENTKAGYEAALQEFFDLKKNQAGERKNAPNFEHHRNLFEQVQRWYDLFGVPPSEAKLSQHVNEFLGWLKSWWRQDTLPDFMPVGAF